MVGGHSASEELESAVVDSAVPAMPLHDFVDLIFGMTHPGFGAIAAAMNIAPTAIAKQHPLDRFILAPYRAANMAARLECLATSCGLLPDVTIRSESTPRRRSRSGVEPRRATMEFEHRVCCYLSPLRAKVIGNQTFPTPFYRRTGCTTLSCSELQGGSTMTGLLKRFDVIASRFAAGLKAAAIAAAARHRDRTLVQRTQTVSLGHQMLRRSRTRAAADLLSEGQRGWMQRRR